MKISVIMPCHNCGRWVQEALQSISAQTYPAHEIIVINDNSTDDSVEMIETSGVPVKLLHTSYGNAAAARNEGIRHATGDWIAFLDADDIWYPSHLALFHEQCGDDQVDLWFSLGDAYDGEATTTLARPDKQCLPAGVVLHQDDTIRSLEAQSGVGYGTVSQVIRKSVLQSLGGFDESQLRRHDKDLFLRVVARHPWRYSGVESHRYRHLREGSISEEHSDCLYFSIRALVKNRELYANPRYDRVIANRARVDLGRLFRLSDMEKIDSILPLCKGLFPLPRRVAYWVAAHSAFMRKLLFKRTPTKEASHS